MLKSLGQQLHRNPHWHKPSTSKPADLTAAPSAAPRQLEHDRSSQPGGIIADACPIECLPNTPPSVLRALAPPAISAAAEAVHSSLHGAWDNAQSAAMGGSGRGSGRGVKRALRRLRGRMSPEGWEAFAREVEAAALRAALQHPPPCVDAMATLGTLGSSLFEDSEDDYDDLEDTLDLGGEERQQQTQQLYGGGGSSGGVAASAAAAAPSMGVAGTLPGHGNHHGHHRHQPHLDDGRHHQQPPHPQHALARGPTSMFAAAPLSDSSSVGYDSSSSDAGRSSPSSVPGLQPWPLPPQGEGSSFGGWSSFFLPTAAATADAGIRQAALLGAVEAHRPTVVGSHPITVLPAFNGEAQNSIARQGGNRSSRGAPHDGTNAATAGGAAAGAAAAPARRARRPDSSARRPLSPASRGGASRTPHFTRLVFGGGGARTLAYAGAAHSLRMLGLVRRLDAVAGASGGAILAVLAALSLGPQEILGAMSALPDSEQLSWMGLNRNLGLTSGAELFGAIEAAVAERTGVAEPTLGDVEAASGVRVFIATTSLARRAPLYLDSRTHSAMRVRDALKASAAIPFFFSPVRSPFDKEDMLVDGCLTDCTPVGALLGADGGSDGDSDPVDPASVLVLAVHDAAGSSVGSSVTQDFNGLVNGLVATALQAGFHHTLRSGVRVLNLFDAVANVDPLQFRMSLAQGREVVAKAQALTERWAVELCSGAGQQQDTAAAAPATTAASESAPTSANANGNGRGERGSGDSADAGTGAAMAPPPAAGAGRGVSPEEGSSGDAGDSVGGAARPSPGRTALLASMGGGGGAGGYVDAAGQQLAHGCDCHPWWLASVDEATAHDGIGRLF